MEAAGRPHFGALLRQFRLDAGLTQQELAERANLSVEAISTLERGVRTRPYRDTVDLLARALELTPEREALLESAVGTAHSSRQRDRSEALHASLLRIVRPDTEATPKHNLPQQLTSFVGRQREVREIAALLREHRLVTIVGAGGVGKTRVAVQVGSDLLDGSPDGVWLIDLAPLEDQTLVESAILNALQLPSTAGSTLDAVVAYLKTRRLLLILDNCEHVIPRAREVASSILQSCPYVRILSTSRQSLEIQGEHVYRLPSLAVPTDSCRSAQDILSYGAVALFLDRALAVDAGFALSEDNAPVIAEICGRLDGIPLAIEMAAARMKVLAPRQIAQRLDQRFRLLTGADARALPRHQTMMALIDWSYDLLTPREQRFFESLSVFSGGCTLEAVTAVCTTEGEDDLDVVELLTSLVTKSLLVAELVDREERYRLLESSRQYAREKLATRGEQERLAQRHALFYVELAERLDRAWYGTPDREWLPQAQVELENWRAALQWALGTRCDVTLGQHLVAAHVMMWCSFLQLEGRHWVRKALELVNDRTPPDLVARLEHAEATVAGKCGEFKVSLAAAERALARYGGLGNLRGSAEVQGLAGIALTILGRGGEAEPLLQDALEAARTLGDRRLAAIVLRHLGAVRGAADDFAGARAYLTEALGLANVLGAELLAADVALNLADSEYDAGDAETALRLVLEVLASYRAMKAPTAVSGTAKALACSMIYLFALGRYDEARIHANEALDLGLRLGMASLVAASLQYLALTVLVRPKADRPCTSEVCAGVARLLGFVNARLASLGVSELYPTPHRYDRAIAMLREEFTVDEFEHQMAIGATMTEDEAVTEAHALK